MEVEVQDQRIRIHLSQTAKGLVQIDVTAEFPTIEDTEKNLDEAVKAARRVIAANTMKEVGGE
jgi:Cys-tRNA synthase (O-phospho-L-seryl-tRNA:Cys-tRNA synthase)